MSITCSTKIHFIMYNNLISLADKDELGFSEVFALFDSLATWLIISLLASTVGNLVGGGVTVGAVSMLGVGDE